MSLMCLQGPTKTRRLNLRMMLVINTVGPLDGEECVGNSQGPIFKKDF